MNKKHDAVILDGKLLALPNKGRFIRLKGSLKGQDAVCVDKAGRCTLALYGKRVYAHRVMWETFMGEIPKGMFVYHKNADRLDNRLSNLELRCGIRSSQRKKSARNKIGVTGVCFTGGEWHSYIFADGKKRSLYHGMNLFEAVARRKTAENRLGYGG